MQKKQGAVVPTVAEPDIEEPDAELHNSTGLVGVKKLPLDTPDLFEPSGGDASLVSSVSVGSFCLRSSSSIIPFLWLAKSVPW